MRSRLWTAIAEVKVLKKLRKLPLREFRFEIAEAEIDFPNAVPSSDPGILKAMVILFNKSLTEEIIPDNMKLAMVKPIYKGGNKMKL